MITLLTIVSDECINFCMSVGIKFIPLRTPGGELIPGSGLFVKTKKAAAATGSTESEASDKEAAAEVKSKPHIHQIRRQEAIEHGTIRDVAKVGVKYGGRNEEGDKAERDDNEDKFNSEDPIASYERRFTSPASLESSPGDLFKEYDSSKLTVVAEVHESTVP